MAASQQDPSAIAEPGSIVKPAALGTAMIVFMVVAAASPLSILAGVVPLSFLFGNGIGIPVMFLVAAVVFLLFSVGLVAMSSKVKQSGGFFSLILQGTGRVPGAAASAVALLAYWALTVGISAYLGYVLQVTIASSFGIDIAWWVYAVLALLIAGALGFQSIDTSSKVLAVLLIAELAVVAVLTVVVVATGGEEGLSLQPFAPAEVFSGSPAIGLMFAASAFIGFEATVIYRREARDPDRTIPRATYLAVSGVGIFYVISSWMLVMAWGPSQAVEVAAQDPGSMLVATAARYLGVFGELATVVLLITSLFAAVLSFHNVLNRYQRSMAQAGVLPAYLAQSHLRTDAPRRAAVVQTVASVALVLLFALLGLDPVVQVFAWLPAIATIAIMTLMAAVSLSVLLFFRNRHPDLGSWRRVIAPALSVISLLAIVVIVLINLPLLAGEIGADGNPAYGPVSVTLVGIVVLVGLAGVIRALIMRRTSPNAYEALVDTLHE